MDTPTDQSLLRTATDSGMFKLLFPVIVTAAIGMLNNSVNKVDTHLENIDRAQQKTDLQTADVISRVVAIEKVIEQKSPERDRQISDLTSSIATLKQSVELLNYRVSELDHSKR